MRRRTLLATGLALALLAGAACSDDEEPPPSADRRSTTTSASTTTSSTTSTTAPVEDGYRKARPDPDLPRQDIDINLRYPASFTPEQVEVVQAWANYRHVFFVTLDPPEPDSPLMGEIADSPVVETNRQQRLDFAQNGWVARLPTDALFRETVLRAEVDGSTANAALTCQVDSSIQTGADGAVIDDDVITKLVEPALAQARRGWIVTQGSEPRRSDGNEEDTVRRVLAVVFCVAALVCPARTALAATDDGATNPPPEGGPGSETEHLFNPRLGGCRFSNPTTRPVNPDDVPSMGRCRRPERPTDEEGPGAPEPIDIALDVTFDLDWPDPLPRTAPDWRSGAALTGVPTWLWVDGIEPISGQSTGAGVVVQVTARPVSTTWNLRAGEKRCTGLGVAYRGREERLHLHVRRRVGEAAAGVGVRHLAGELDRVRRQRRQLRASGHGCAVLPRGRRGAGRHRLTGRPG